MAVRWSGTNGFHSAFKYSVIFAAVLITTAQSDCGVPPTFHFARLIDSDFGIERFTAGSSVTYQCHPGYSRIRGLSSQIICSKSAEWSELPEFCQKRKCGSPGELLNGHVDLEDTQFGSTATFSCDKGYRLVGRAERQCLHDGKWSNVVPVCEPVICINPPEIAGGSHSNRGKDEFTYQSGVTYYCNSPSLSLIGEPSIFCTENGNWSGNPPACRDIRCPNPEIRKGQVTSSFQSQYRLGDRITFQCDYGFIINGSGVSECTIANRWLPSPECLHRESCPEPKLENGEVHGFKETFKSGLEIGYRVDSLITFRCGPRYRLIHQHMSSSCGKDLKWNPRIPRCIVRDSCPEPDIKHGKINGSRYISRFGSETGFRIDGHVTFSCDSGYILMGEKTSVCQRNISWSTEIPTCEARESCSAPEIRNGYVKEVKETFKSGRETGYRVLANVTVVCHPDHVLHGSSEITCGEDLQWLPAVPTCERTLNCADPVVQNGRKISGFGHSYKYGQSVEFECDRGFTLVGSGSITCGEDSEWHPPVPTCQIPLNCADPVVQNGRKISGFGHSYKYGQSVEFECDRGFTLVGSGSITCGEDSEWHPPVPTCQIHCSAAPVKEKTGDYGKSPGGGSTLCEFVDQKTKEPFEEAEIGNYKFIMDMKKQCLEIQKLELEIWKLRLEIQKLNL